MFLFLPKGNLRQQISVFQFFGVLDFSIRHPILQRDIYAGLKHATTAEVSGGFREISLGLLRLKK